MVTFQHLFLNAFYKPDRSRSGRYKIMFENHSFPSDRVSFYLKRAVVVAHLTRWSLSITKDPGLNPVIGNFY